MATAAARRSGSRRKHKSPSQWWSGFKKTDRYKVVRFIVLNSYRMMDRLTNQPGADARLRRGAHVVSAKVGSTVAPRAKGFGERIVCWIEHLRDVRDFSNLRNAPPGTFSDDELDSYMVLVNDRHPDRSHEDALQGWKSAMIESRREGRGGGTVRYSDTNPDAHAARMQDVYDLYVADGGRVPAEVADFVHGSGSAGSSGAQSIPVPQRRQAPSRPAAAIPSRRPATRKVDRPTQLHGAWDHKFNQIKGNVMAADGNLSGALAQIRAFVEYQPQDRSELHAQLAGFAGLFEQLGGITESFRSTLERPLPDGTPGVPSYITSHLAPVPDHGTAIGQCATRTAHAWEDRFADAVKVAADEEKPSDEYLRAPAS